MKFLDLLLQLYSLLPVGNYLAISLLRFSFLLFMPFIVEFNYNSPSS